MGQLETLNAAMGNFTYLKRAFPLPKSGKFLRLNRCFSMCEDILSCSTTTSCCLARIPPVSAKFFDHLSNIIGRFREASSVEKEAIHESPTKWQDMQHQA